jgi:hypothetical protein
MHKAQAFSCFIVSRLNSEISARRFVETILLFVSLARQF